jgi:flagellin-specific chaperone FliS
MTIRRRILTIIFILFSIFLSACLDRKTTPEKMYEVMEQVVSAEIPFEAKQEPIVNAEKEEKEIYDEIITLGLKEYEEIVELSNKALLLIEERRTLITEESASIAKSKEQFEQLKPFIDKLENRDLQKKAMKLYDVMFERYRLHEELQLSYIEALNLDRELYEMFKNKAVAIDQLENQINLINDTYSEIYEINDHFNKSTATYNDLKLSFYKEAGLKIENNK